MPTAAKSGQTPKKGKPRGRPFSGKDDPRINRAGRPSTGQSWAELIREIGNMDGPTAGARFEALVNGIKSKPAGVTLRELVIARVYRSLIEDPQAGLLNAFMDRAEGKIVQPVEQHIVQQVEAYDYGSAIAPLAPRPVGDRDTPGEDQGADDGSALGQDVDGG